MHREVVYPKSYLPYIGTGGIVAGHPKTSILKPLVDPFITAVHPGSEHPPLKLKKDLPAWPPLDLCTVITHAWLQTSMTQDVAS